jgi:HAD superfamily hydrolase (TIGR01509 family)
MKLRKECGMPELQAVLFDLDGVLIDSCEAWFKLVNSTARHFCKPDVTQERFNRCWGQGIDADLQEFFPGCEAREVERYYEEHLLDFDSCIQIEPGACDLFCRLRDAGISRGVVTNTPVTLARDLLAWSGLIGLVDITAGAAREYASKPAPDLVLHACRELEVSPERAILVGDSRFDAEAAEAAHVPFLAFRSNHGPSVQNFDELLARLLPPGR